MVKKQNLPIFYHPTNVLAIDDERDFLNDLSASIDPIFPYILRESPSKALEYLKTHTYNLEKISLEFAQSKDDLSAGHSIEMFDLHFSVLRANLDSPERYKKITVVIADQMMPEMKGLDFCRRVRELRLPVKILLLTGISTLHEAVDAFNEGIIDAFVSKGDYHLKSKINEAIRSLAWEQFLDYSNNLLGFLSCQANVLKNEYFIKIFDDILEKYSIQEFYLLDTTYSYLLLNQNAQAKILMVRSSGDFETMYEMAQSEKAPYSVLQALRDKQAYPFSRFNNPFPRAKGDAFDEIMVPVEKILGREVYYAVLDGPDIDAYSFDQYIGEEWPKP